MGNVLIDEQFCSKLCDFGLSVQLQDEHGRRNSLCGTPNYIAPEIVSKKDYSFKVDIWSLGCLIYLLETGVTPFDRGSMNDTLRAVKKIDYDTKKIAKSPFRKIIKKCLMKNEKKRLTAEEVLYQLKRIKRKMGSKGGELSARNIFVKEVSPKNNDLFMFKTSNDFRNPKANQSNGPAWGDLNEQLHDVIKNETARTTSATLAKSEKFKKSRARKSTKKSRKGQKSKKASFMNDIDISNFVKNLAIKDRKTRKSFLNRNTTDMGEDGGSVNFKARSKTQTELFFRNNYFRKNKRHHGELASNTKAYDFSKIFKRDGSKNLTMTSNLASRTKRYDHLAQMNSAKPKQGYASGKITGHENPWDDKSCDKYATLTRRRSQKGTKIRSFLQNNILNDEKQPSAEDNPLQFTKSSKSLHKLKILSGEFGEKELQTLLNKAKSEGKKKEKSKDKVKKKSDLVEIKRILEYSRSRESIRTTNSRARSKQTNSKVDKIFLQENFLNTNDWSSSCKKSPEFKRFETGNLLKQKFTPKHISKMSCPNPKDFLSTFQFDSRSMERTQNYDLKEKNISGISKFEKSDRKSKQKLRSKSMKHLEKGLESKIEPFRISEKVKPIKMEIKLGKLEVCKDLNIRIYLKKDNVYYTVSSNGAKITVENCSKNFTNVYSLENLPNKYVKHYKYAKKIVNILNKKALKKSLSSLKKRSNSHVNISNLTKKVKSDQIFTEIIAQSARNLSLHSNNFSKIFRNNALVGQSNPLGHKPAHSMTSFADYLFHVKDKYGFFGLRKDKTFEAVFDNGVKMSLAPNLDSVIYTAKNQNQKKIPLKGVRRDERMAIPKEIESFLKIALRRRKKILQNFE